MLLATLSLRRMALALCAALIPAALAGAAQPLSSQAAFDIGFSPRGESLNIVLNAIHAARSSILVAAYSFTSKPISTALLAAHRRGLTVKLVADEKSNRQNYSAAHFLANQGVPVRLNSHYAIHHHKFMVIDGEHLETGSFNYSAAAAQKNAENVLVLWNVKPMAHQYAIEWQRLWDEGADLRAAY